MLLNFVSHFIWLFNLYHIAHLHRSHSWGGIRSKSEKCSVVQIAVIIHLPVTVSSPLLFSLAQTQISTSAVASDLCCSPKNERTVVSRRGGRHLDRVMFHRWRFKTNNGRYFAGQVSVFPLLVDVGILKNLCFGCGESNS